MSSQRGPARQPFGSHGFRHAMACVALVVLTLGTFSNALRNEFVDFDDWLLVETNPRIRSLSWPNVRGMFTERILDAWLPLRLLSYAVDYHFWGLNAFGYHLTNLCLHTANVLLVYAVVLWFVGRKELAWLGAAWFAVHPVQVESVTWVSGRRDVLYGFFFLLSLTTFLRYWRGGRRRWWFYGASVGCFALSMLSKASGVMLPVLLGLLVVLFDDGACRARPALGGQEGDVWRRLLACAPHGVVAVATTWVHVHNAQQTGVVKEGFVLAGRLASVPWIFSTYWRLLFFPVHLATPQARAPLAWSEGRLIAVHAVVVVAVIVVVWLAAPRRAMAFFCLGWWFGMLAPVSHLIPLSMLVAERYLYMPLVGACVFGAALVGKLAEGRRRRGVVAACALAVVALFATATHRRNRAWANPRTFWHDGVSKWPRNPVGRIGLGAVYVDRAEPVRGWNQYMMVLLPDGLAYSANKEHRDLVENGVLRSFERAGRCLEARGRRGEALRVYEQAAELFPNRVVVQVRLAEAYERRGLREEARAQVAKARGLYGQQRDEGKEAFELLNARRPWLKAWMERRERGPILGGTSRRP